MTYRPSVRCLLAAAALAAGCGEGAAPLAPTSEAPAALERLEFSPQPLLPTRPNFPKLNVGLRVDFPGRAIQGAYTPNGIRTTDLNRDGIPDLVLVTQGTSGIQYVLNDGMDQIDYLRFASTYNSMRDVAIADMNHDNRLDLVTASDSGPISVALSSSPGFFSTPAQYSPGYAIQRVAAADMNGDTHTDVAFIVTGSANVGFYVGDAVGKLSGPYYFSVGATPFGVAVADFDRDGKNDIVTTLRGTDSVGLLLNTGRYTFAPVASFNVGSAPNHIEAADVDGDGNMDVVVTATAKTQVYVLLGDGVGGFGFPQGFNTTEVPTRPTLADINRDGKLDIVVGGGSSVDILLNIGGGRFAPPQNQFVGASATAVAAADLDLDGALDLAVTDTTNQQVRILYGRPAGTFVRSRISTGKGNFSKTLIGDFNGDTKPDLLLAENYALRLSPGDGAGGMGTVTDITTTPGAITVLAQADMNGDGKLDYLYADTDDTKVAIGLGDGSGGFAAPRRYSTSGTVHDLLVADFNGDGKPDVATASTSTGEISVLLNDGTGALGAAKSRAVTSASRYIAAADVNLDKKMDLVVADNIAAKVNVLLGDGTGGFGSARTYNVSGGQLILQDWNGDLRPDITILDQSGRNVILMYGNGTGSFLSTLNFGLEDPTPLSMRVTDVNADGLADLLVCGGRSVQFLLGDARGSFNEMTGNMYPDASNACAVGDVNGDRLPDVVSTTYSSTQRISVLLNHSR